MLVSLNARDITTIVVALRDYESYLMSLDVNGERLVCVNFEIANVRRMCDYLEFKLDPFKDSDNG